MVQQSIEDRVARLHEEIAAICAANRLYREGGKKKSGAVDYERRLQRLGEVLGELVFLTY